MKVGDRVTVFDGIGDLTRISTITRETKLYWFVKSPHGEEKYKKSTGKTVSDRYYSRSIQPATQEHYDYIKKANLCYHLSTWDWKKLDLSTLERIYAIVCGLTDTKDAEQ